MLFRSPIAGIGLAGFVVLVVFLLLQNSPASIVPTGWKPTINSDPKSILDTINNATLGFEKIFVIGLPERTDRRDGIALQASLSDMAIEFIDGVPGDKVPDQAIPKTKPSDRAGPGVIGCWRAHMDAMREIVTKNISSALIIEDDADWDIRIRQQLHDMALSTQALTQPLIAAPGSYADPTYPSAEPDANTPVHEIPFDNLPETIAPRDSPYGDDWDLIWVGHCGQRMPPPDSPLPRGRVVHRDEMSTPAKKYLWSMAHPYTLVDDYPEHTRVVHHSQEGVCTLGYAISQKGARAVLQHVALQDLDAAVDILLRFFCEGLNGRTKHNCLAIQPALFNHHRPRGPLSSESNIGNHGDGFRETASTDMVRWSVRMNAETLMEGGSEFWDQLPDP